MNQMVTRFRNLFSPPPLPLPRERYRPRLGRRADRGGLAELLRIRQQVLAEAEGVGYLKCTLPATAPAATLPEDAPWQCDAIPPPRPTPLPLFVDDDPEIEVAYIDELDTDDAPTKRMNRGEVLAIELTDAYQQARADPDLIMKPDIPAPRAALGEESATEAQEVIDVELPLVHELEHADTQHADTQRADTARADSDDDLELSDDELELSDDELELSDDELEFEEADARADGVVEIQEVEVELDFEDLIHIDKALGAAALAHAAESGDRQAQPEARAIQGQRSAALAVEPVRAAKGVSASTEEPREDRADLAGALFSAIQVAVRRRPDGAIEVRPLAVGQALPEGATVALLVPRSAEEGAELLQLFARAG